MQLARRYPHVKLRRAGSWSKVELTRALINSSGHNIQARHNLIFIIVIVGHQLKGLENRALDALGQVFVAEDTGVRLAQLAADLQVSHEGSNYRRIVLVATPR